MLIFIRNLYFHFCFFFFPLPLMTTPQIHLVFHWRGSDPYVGNHWIKLLCSLHWCISINTLLMFTLKFLSLHIFMILLLCVYIVLSFFFFSFFFFFTWAKDQSAASLKALTWGMMGIKGQHTFWVNGRFPPNDLLILAITSSGQFLYTYHVPNHKRLHGLSLPIGPWRALITITIIIIIIIITAII